MFAAYNDVSAIDVATGKTRWTQGACWPYSSMFVAGGHLITQTCPDGVNQLSALDEKTGKVLWRSQVDAPAVSIPAIYTYKGREYILFAVGGNSILEPKVSDQLVAYALPGR